MICCHFVRRLVMYGLTGSQYQTLACSQSKITEQETQTLNTTLPAQNRTESHLESIGRSCLTMSQNEKVFKTT